MARKPPPRTKHIWEIRTRLKLASRARNLALFNLAIDSKLRGCDVVKPRITDVMAGGGVRQRSTVVQQKTDRPHPFEITEPTCDALGECLKLRRAVGCDWLFPSRLHQGEHLTTRHHARLVDEWVQMVGLDASAYGTHSLRRMMVAMIYKRTGDLRAFQLLLGHTKLESTVRDLGMEADDAPAISEQAEI